MIARGLTFGMLALFLAGCASKANLVVVLPESNGHIGTVVVHQGNQATVVHGAYAAAGGGSGDGTMRPVAIDATEVTQIFGPALAAQPIPPKQYTLYFVSDSDTLTPDSQTAFADVFVEIARRRTAEIVVTGHTDTFGSDDYNDQLSLQRAKAVRELFIKHGLPADSVLAAGRGKRDLLIKTADQVHELRNRRVVITVR